MSGVSIFAAALLASLLPASTLPRPSVQSAPVSPAAPTGSSAPSSQGATLPQGAPSAQGSQGVPIASADAEPAPPVVLPEFDGLADGLTKLQLAVGEGKTDVALGLADALLAPNAWAKLRTGLEGEHAWLRRGFDAVEPAVARIGFGGPSARARAEVHYAAGVALDRGGDGAAARARFVTALALAGPGNLRLDAGYNVGAIALGLAERLREAQQQAPPPGALQAQVAPAPQGPDSPDPLDQLEAAYRAAKSELIERLRADWHDEDTRANLEFIQRRLREIEQQREEQQQQQQQEQKQDSKQDPQKSDQQKSDEQKQDSEQDPSASDEERKDSEQQKPEESKPEDPQKSDEQKQDESKSDEQQAKQDPAQESKDPKDAKPTQGKQEERVLTREEVMRILSQLEEIEKEGKALEARLRRSRRATAEKDW